MERSQTVGRRMHWASASTPNKGICPSRSTCFVISNAITNHDDGLVVAGLLGRAGQGGRWL
jgi:hypothetical protein